MYNSTAANSDDGQVHVLSDETGLQCEDTGLYKCHVKNLAYNHGSHSLLIILLFVAVNQIFIFTILISTDLVGILTCLVTIHILYYTAF